MCVLLYLATRIKERDRRTVPHGKREKEQSETERQTEREKE